MTDLERAKEYIVGNKMRTVEAQRNALKDIDTHEEEDAAREADWESRADFFNRTYKLLDEKEAELAALREAVWEHLERWECGGRLRQLIEEKPTYDPGPGPEWERGPNMKDVG